jgi:hypothetical protein
MTRNQNAKLNMYRTVLDVCKLNPNAYAGVKAFVDGVKELETNVADILTVEGLKSNVSVVSSTLNKQGTEDSLVVLTMQVANGSYALAFATGNTEWLKQSTTNKSELYRMRGNELLVKAKNISKNARANAEQLADYGITAEILTALDTVIAEFEQVLTKPRDTTVERKVYTESLPKLFSAADSTLYDKLDKLIVLFRNSAPEFFSAYRAARNVVYAVAAAK